MKTTEEERQRKGKGTKKERGKNEQGKESSF